LLNDLPILIWAPSLLLYFLFHIQPRRGTTEQLGKHQGQPKTLWVRSGVWLYPSKGWPLPAYAVLTWSTAAKLLKHMLKLKQKENFAKCFQRSTEQGKKIQSQMKYCISKRKLNGGKFISPAISLLLLM